MIPLALAALCVGFSVAYLVCRRLDNYGFVDFFWAAAFTPLVWFYALNGETGWGPRRWAVATLASFWSLRLAAHLFRRVAGHHPQEDSRYVQMRQRWAGHFHRTMFGFFQLQAASVVLLALPFWLTMRNNQPTLHVLEVAGALLWLLALAGEALADAQLAAWKRQPTHRGEVCAVGLWRLSRHPNYFFEWLVWVAFALVALPASFGWVAFTAPALILFLLLRVSGIPLNEEVALRSKGDAYRRYQKTTSTFVPWFPKQLP